LIIYRTGHEIADTVADALAEGFNGFPECDAAIGYGILRGMDKALARHKHWFLVDRGYFDPAHYSGYYRISYKGTQARYSEYSLVTSEYSKPLQNIRTTGDYVLICPPTEAVCGYFGVIYSEWCKSATHEAEANGFKWVMREKGNPIPLADMLAKARAVITFNSSVGWQALQRGIPCLSDVQNSVVGSYYGVNSLADVITLHDTLPREPLFNFMRSHQFTLEEIRQGKAWCIIKYYLSTSDMTAEKQLQQTFAPTALEGAPSPPPA